MSGELTKKVAYSELQAFFNQKPLVLFGTSTSCAVDGMFGMAALKDHPYEKFFR